MAASRPSATSATNKIFQFKLVLLGESAVGKSSLVLRFVKGQFQEYQESTIGGKGPGLQGNHHSVGLGSASRSTMLKQNNFSGEMGNEPGLGACVPFGMGIFYRSKIFRTVEAFSRGGK